jgi:hypothetical protein
MDKDYTKKIEALEAAAQKLGLYLEGHAVYDVDAGDREVPLLAVRFTVGKIAFADRTQDPVKDDTERKFKELVAESDKDDYDNLKERMKRNIDAGRDPMDDGEEEE